MKSEWVGGWEGVHYTRLYKMLRNDGFRVRFEGDFNGLFRG